jgi:hypothetical protein
VFGIAFDVGGEGMSAASKPDVVTPPTDEELMFFVDGELDVKRHAEVMAHVAHDPIGHRKVLALRLAGDVLRESHEARASSGIVDAVMRDIDAAVGRRPSARVVSLDAGRANRPARQIYAMAAVAMAAAAGLAVWGRAGTESVEPLSAATTATSSRDLDLAAPSRDLREPRVPAASSPDEHGAEVAAVDFGTRTGSIFYVPTDATEPTVLAVVWISDSEAKGP